MAGSKDITITLYWLNDSRAQNIVWLLESLRLPYQIKAFKRMPSGLAPPEMKDIHPLGKSPVVSIEWPGSGKPLVLAESGNIIEYLIDHFGGVEKGLVPQRYARDENGQDTETESWLRYRFFMHYSEGSLMPNLVLQLILERIRNPPVPFFIKPLTRLVANAVQTSFLDKQFAVHFPFLEDQLKTAPGVDSSNGHRTGGLCGKDFTAADMLISFGVIAATDAGLITEYKFPEIVAYTRRIKENEAYKRGLARVADIESGKVTASL
ncbi:hypothetical protein MPDQ_007961 [Monascus purpureus]|uniref:GST N-terminal domain-containing protein n=1 Tax=Monascus purpureus TaxID=5098 RepID=A0A507QR35_MONPU|nr:hypothetical protein MPDQ_007961 [Monascus purpureus]BDD55794.1 hypothetical protein MAP00_001282 [Monascus purpureus]